MGHDGGVARGAECVAACGERVLAGEARTAGARSALEGEDFARNGCVAANGGELGKISVELVGKGLVCFAEVVDALVEKYKTGGTGQAVEKSCFVV